MVKRPKRRNGTSIFAAFISEFCDFALVLFTRIDVLLVCT